MVLGPAVVGLLYPFLGFTGVFLAGAVVTAAGGVLLLGLRITEVDEPEQAGRTVAGGLPRRTVRSLAVLVGLFAVVDLVNNALFAALEPVVPLHLDELTGDGVVYTSVIFTAGLAVFMLGATFGGRFVESKPLLGIVVVAFAVEAVGLAAVGLLDGVAAMSAGLLLFMIAQPVLYLVARQGVSLVPRQLRGRAFGVFGLVSDIGFIVGPLLGAVAYAGLGTPVFLIMAALAAVAALAAAPLRGLPARLLATAHEDPDHEDPDHAPSPVGKPA
jgi:MFS family permease